MSWFMAVQMVSKRLDESDDFAERITRDATLSSFCAVIGGYDALFIWTVLRLLRDSLMEDQQSQLRARKAQSQQSISNGRGEGGGDAATTTHSQEKVRRDGGASELGFLHWLLVFCFVGVVYGAMAWQDQRMPPVVYSADRDRFSEERARVVLNALTELGPRPSGSDNCEIHAFRILTSKIEQLKKVVEQKNVNRLEMDVQRPSGCFDLKFLSVFTLCYHRVTNLVARIGPRGQRPTDQAILINCHYDTLPDTPGATDDAVSCAIMMDVLEVLAHSEKPLENDILFLFNAAEENFLQASHGFITEHPWRHSVRAFINLEGCGAGGRELVFQTGPGESWLIKTYLDNVPHPHCSVTFVFFATTVEYRGSTSPTFAMALIRSPYLKQPADFNEGSNWVFFDVVGMFTVFFSMRIAVFLHYSVCLFVAFVVWRRLQTGAYTVGGLLAALWHQILAFGAMIAIGAIVVAVLTVFNLTMAWYATPVLVFPLYILPMLTASIAVHNEMAQRAKRKGVSIASLEKVHYDFTIMEWALVLLVLTWLGTASSFLFFIHVFFPLLRDPLVTFLASLGLVKASSPRALLAAQIVCLTPVIAMCSGHTQMLFEFFVPTMGRLGNRINPELVMMAFSLVVAFTFVLFTNNLAYMSRPLNFMIKCMSAVAVFTFLIIATTSVGVPYKFSEDEPRVRRLIALHATRRIYNFDKDFDGNQTSALNLTESGLFVQTLDYRGPDDLPEHTFLQGAGQPDCSRTSDEYCQLPYYTAVHELFPPERSRWVPLPTEPHIAKPLSVRLVQRQYLSGNLLNLTIAVRGGVDKSSMHITPLNGFQLRHWSLTPFDPTTFGTRKTYFVFMTYGFEAPKERLVWILLENNERNVSVADDVPSLELAVASKYVHGKNQNSDTLLQLRSLIANRRRTPHAGVGFWRWAITMIAGVSEIVIHFF
uniref:FXNA-like protease n=1 Tax=Globodera rostochiensis TaxID=31243 RepID=A0A914I7J6_GLORO